MRFLALAVLLAACGGGASPTSEPSPSPSASASPSPQTEGIRFVLEATYEVAESVDVAIENLGPATYLYNQEYAACDLTYRNQAGREFIVPPGTHCDLIAPAEIRPGETKTLFRWDLDECVRDEWGCVKSEPLPPGEYTIAGRFERSAEANGPLSPADGTGEWDRASATFTITEPAAA